MAINCLVLRIDNAYQETVWNCNDLARRIGNLQDGRDSVGGNWIEPHIATLSQQLDEYLRSRDRYFEILCQLVKDLRTVMPDLLHACKVIENTPRPPGATFDWCAFHDELKRVEIEARRNLDACESNVLQVPTTRLEPQHAAPAAEITVLFLTADPNDAPHLRYGREIREIRKRLHPGQNPMVKLETRTAATAQDLTTAIFEVKPQIIHFAGHGTGNGELCFETPTGETFPVEPSAFAGLLEELNDNVQCVVLNACHSRKPALAIEQHVPFVVGMNAAISDEAAIVFAGEFYQALAYGRPIPKAFKIAVAALEVLKIPGADIPQLIHQAPK
jgi:hypothetical protein